MKLDLHIHTKYSKDSRLEPTDILKAAKSKGLDGISVTDHNTLKGGVETEKVAKDFKIIKGAEIKTNKGEVIGYFLEDEIISRDYWEVTDEIKSQGGMVCIPHPFDFFRINRLRFDKEMLKVVDAVEVRNSRCVLKTFNNRAMELAERNGLKKTAGSDAHSLSEIGTSGLIVDSIENIRSGDVEFFGGKTPFLNLLITKAIKTFGR